jgi:hypothetical protein
MLNMPGDKYALTPVIPLLCFMVRKRLDIEEKERKSPRTGAFSFSCSMAGRVRGESQRTQEIIVSLVSAAGQWPPTACEMPDLSHLSANTSLAFVLNRVFTGGGPKDPKSYALVMNFIRIVDHLVAEYEQTRAALTEFVNTPNNVISPIFDATNYYESCISTMIRVIRLGRRIRNDRKSPPIAKKIPVLSNQIWDRVNNMRGAIQHIDERISKNTWLPGEPVCLLVKSDRLELNGEEILYSELADWVKQLNELGAQLAPFKEP